MEKQPQNPEFRINPENFHQCNLFLDLGNYAKIWNLQTTCSAFYKVSKTDAHCGAQQTFIIYDSVFI